ncbi:hypothetical protein [Devosia sp. RR2S18]|uniref:hypothetical protein n=1 Tax=Devosia rhizosphaerae TaxID=3049774 RepID=UPI0025408C5A|nr:hypothetical protein [Devosia sp. RR2S18]WIJ26602.1 hypothetical protein QOV41_07580 [Devosia sp. RR2S18]
MASRAEILLELDRRGKLPANLQPALAEAKRRGLIGAGNSPAPSTSPAQTDIPASIPKVTGLAENIGAGFDSGVNMALGAPVDLPVWLGNSVVNATNSGLEIAGAGRPIPNIPVDLPGSRIGWERTQENLGFTPPSAVEPADTGQRLARAGAEAIGSALVPEALAVKGAQVVQTAAQAASPVLRKVVDTASTALGTDAAATGMVRNQVINAAAGAGAQGGMDAAPEPLKPVAGIVGGLAGGGGAVAVTAAPSAARRAASAAQDFAAPLSPAGREELAGRQLRENATSGGQVIEDIETAPPPAVPGAEPTTGQLTGDLGLLALERKAMNQPGQTEKFTERRAQQNSARITALKGLETGGNPVEVAKAVRAHIDQADAAAETATEGALAGARSRAAAVGEGRPPDIVGDEMRGALEEGRAVAKERESALWRAVDPDGSLALPASSTKDRADEIITKLPASAKAPEGEEAAVLDLARGYQDVVPFSELSALHSRLKTAMAVERNTNGRTPAYRRMSMMSSAIFDDMEKAVRRQVVQDNQAIARGDLDPANSITARLNDVTVPSAGKMVYTPSGRKVPVEYQVVDADALVPSQLDDLRPNPRFDASLQPRDRSRAASDVQIARIAGELQPERLGPSASAAEGAPIIGSDGMVESGNARVLAIRRAYQQNGPQAAAYREYLASQGFDTSGLAKPVLVRRRTVEMSPEARSRFVQEANAPTTLTMSAGERARTDASRLTPDQLSLYRGGDLDGSQNRDFVRGFLKSVADQGEEGAFTTADGRLSLEGTQRMRGALLHAAYEDAPLVEALTENGDENIKAFGRALTDLAGDVAKLKSGIKAGQIDPGADLSKPLVEAAKLVQDARRRGITIADAVAQQDAFSRLSDDARGVLSSAYGQSLKGRLSQERFNSFMRTAISELEQQSTEARLFGEASSVGDVLHGVTARYGTTDQASQQSAYSPSTWQGGGEGRQAVRGPGSGSTRSGLSEARGRDGSERVLEQPQLEPNFDQAALDRLGTARQATTERASTFDNKTLGPLTKRPSEVAPYNVSASSVPARIFKPGAKAKDDIRTFRQAVGDERAIPLLNDYAVNRVRAAAMREDATFDPLKLAAFRRSHADALSELPKLNEALSSAEKASKFAQEVAKTQRQATAERQRSSLGKLLNLDDPEDIVRTVGGMFGKPDSVRQVQTLRQAVGDDADAKAGLKQAVVDHVMTKFISNTEAGTSQQNLIRADQFQTFVKTNKPALKAAGFADNDLSMLEGVAESIHQANRSIASIKVPGSPGTAQDLLKAKFADKIPSLLGRAVVSGTAGAGMVSFFLGNFIGTGAAVGAILLNAARQAGLDSVDDLVADALLNPERARVLMLKAKPEQMPKVGLNLAQMYRRAALATASSLHEPEAQ